MTVSQGNPTAHLW